MLMCTLPVTSCRDVMHVHMQTKGVAVEGCFLGRFDQLHLRNIRSVFGQRAHADHLGLQRDWQGTEIEFLHSQWWVREVVAVLVGYQ